MADDETDVFAEFCAAGLWPGVGAALVAEMAEAGITGPTGVTEAALAALPTVTDKRARRLYSAWIGVGVLYDLAGILVPTGLPTRWVRRLADQLGDAAATRIAADPWLLLTLPDVTVAEADTFARRVDRAAGPHDPRRLRAVLVRVLTDQSRSGHTVCPLGLVAGELAAFGLGAPRDVIAAVDAGVANGTVRRCQAALGTPMPGSPAPEGAPPAAAVEAVALETLAAAEEAVATHLARISASARRLATDKAARAAAADLDAVQSAAVIAAAKTGVTLLTGGPGTGKSRTVTAVVRLCRAAGIDVAVAAPTGRAAKRLTELLTAGAGDSENGAVPDEPGDDDPYRVATTIHRLLGARLAGPGHGAIFEHDVTNPIDAGMVVIDETSMLDTELAAALLAAIPNGAHVLFVGDPAQLPSIGPGRVLGDMIEAGRFTVTELTTLYRHDAGGAIARLAAAVRGGELVAPDAEDHEVVVVPARDSADAAHRVVQLVTDSIPRVFGLAADEIQVVTPVHRGPAGTAALNAALKTVLNPGPHGGSRPVRGFDVGDRVVATANHLDAEPTGYANGEIGTVVETAGKSLLVAFPGGNAEIAGKALGDLTHGWAITVHRAQGSEWPAVVAVFPREAGRMLSRPLVYTALTRARLHLSAVTAAGPGLAHAVRRVGAEPRRTRLAEILRGAVIPGAAKR